MLPRHKYEVPGRLADVDVPLQCQHQGEVDAGVVEHLGQGLGEHLKEEAGGAAPVHVLVTAQEENVKNFEQSAVMCHPLIECVGVDKPGGGAEDHQEVTGGDGHQDRVGRGHHPGSERKERAKLIRIRLEKIKSQSDLFKL